LPAKSWWYLDVFAGKNDYKAPTKEGDAGATQKKLIGTALTYTGNIEQKV